MGDNAVVTNLNRQSFRRIETDRLILREFHLDDAEDVLAFASHPEVTRYTGDEKEVQNLDDAKRVITDIWHHDYQTYGYGRLAVELKSSHQVIGFCGLKFLPEFELPDLGYRFLPEHWGLGIATESGRAVLDQGRKTLGIRDEILGLVMPANVASQRVLIKLGFERTGEMVLDGHDIVMFQYQD